GLSRVPSYAAQAVHSLSAPAHRLALLDRWQEGLLSLLEGAAPRSDHQLTFVRCLAETATSEQSLDVLEALLEGSVTFEGLEVDQDLRWALLTGLARAGRVDELAIAAEEEADSTITGKENAAAARAARPDPAAKQAAWQ